MVSVWLNTMQYCSILFCRFDIVMTKIYGQKTEKVFVSVENKGQSWAQHSRKPNSPLVVFVAFSTNKTFFFIIFGVICFRDMGDTLICYEPIIHMESWSVSRVQHFEYFTVLFLCSENNDWFSPIYILCLWTYMFPTRDLTCVSKTEHSEIKFSWHTWNEFPKYVAKWIADLKRSPIALQCTIHHQQSRTTINNFERNTANFSATRNFYYI